MRECFDYADADIRRQRHAGIELARRTIAEGAARAKLDAYIAFSVRHKAAH